MSAENEPDSERVHLLRDNATLETARSKTSVKAEEKAPTSRKVLVLFSCIMQLVLCSGLSYGLSVMYAELIEVFSAPRSEAALVQSLNMGLSTGAGILAAGMVRKYGPGICIVVGSLVGCAALCASPVGQNLVVIIVCTGVVAGVGFGMCYLSAFIAVGWMFHTDASVYLIILTSGNSFGQLILPLLFEEFISKYTWFSAFSLVAGVCLNCLPCGLIIHYSRRYFRKKSTSAKGNAFCDRGLLTDILVWIIWIDYLLMACSWNVESWFIVDHMVSRGFTRESGSFLVSAVGFGNMLGRVLGVVFGFKCKNLPTMCHWLYLFLILVAAHSIVPNLEGFWPLMITCAMVGLVLGIASSHCPAIMFQVSGMFRYPQGMAMLNIMVGIGDMLGPIVGGYLKDITGSYNIVFYLASVASAFIWVSSIAALVLLKRRNQLSPASENKS